MALSKATQRFLERVRGQRVNRSVEPILSPTPPLVDRLTIRQRLQQSQLAPKDGLSRVMDILVGGEGEELMLHSWNNSISPSLETLNVGDIMNSVMAEMPEFNQGNQRVARRTRRR